MGENPAGMRFRPEMDLVQRHEKNICTGSPYSGLWGSYIRRIWRWQEALNGRYYIEGMELKKLGILQSEENAARMTGGRTVSGMVGSITVYRRRNPFCNTLDREYPKRLLHIYDYPMGLYVKESCRMRNVPPQPS